MVKIPKIEAHHTNKTPRDEEYIKAYLMFHSQTKAAEYCGVGRSTIARAVVRAGILLDGRNTNGGNCKKITDEQILESVKTMTRGEIAEKYSLHVENLARRMRKLGVHAVYAKPKPKPKQPKPAQWHWTAGTAAMVEKRQNGKFALIEYKGDRFKLKCLKCGTQLERAKSTVRRNNIICQECKKAIGGGHQGCLSASKRASMAFLI